MEKIIEKRNIVNISEEKNINKNRLGLKELNNFNLNTNIFKFCEFPSGNFVSVNNKTIKIFDNKFNKIQSLYYKKDYLAYKEKFKYKDSSSNKDNKNFNEHSNSLTEHENINKNILYIIDDKNFGIIYNNDILLYSKKSNQFELNEIIFDADINLKYLCFYLNKLITCSER